MNFTLITALLCTFFWISVSEFHTVEVQPGEEVTLLCSNFTAVPSHIFWFKLANRHNISCISSMMSSDGNTSFCDGFQNSKFNMTSNSKTLFLKIKQVDSSDSGLYFCGFYLDEKSVIVSATYLKIQVFDGLTKLMSVILAGLTAFINVVVICLAVQIKKPHKADNEEQNPQWTENLDSDDLKNAALSSSSTANRRPESEREVQTRVVYAASRLRKQLCTSSHQSVKLLKFADNTTHTTHRWEVDHLVTWCNQIKLEFNTLKTVEMVVDYRKNSASPAPITLLSLSTLDPHYQDDNYNHTNITDRTTPTQATYHWDNTYRRGKQHKKTQSPASPCFAHHTWNSNNRQFSIPLLPSPFPTPTEVTPHYTNTIGP
ncbi:uncharacterized protein [Chaetodon trifascialis]|uniref:uncharacterized protein n=1 Tax=Chaetodon trifascialis TaxID=109706 RepID=UPI003993C10B